MIIITILILLVPALISVLCYEKFKGYELTWVKRIELFLILAFLINMFVYAVFWLRGWELISWTFDADSGAALVSFVVQYMIFSLVASVILPYILSLVRVGKSRVDNAEDDDRVEEKEQNGIN